MQTQLSSQDLSTLKSAIKDNFFFFCSLILGDFYEEGLHTDLCDFLQKPSAGRLIILPRGFLKTTIGAVCYSLWRAVNNPEIRVLISSNTTTNAEKTVHSIRTIVETNSFFQKMFPEIIPDFEHTRWSDRCACVKRKNDHPEGTFESAGVGSNIIRRHFNLIIEDDTVAPKRDELSQEEAMPSRNDIEQAIGFHKLMVPLLIDEADERIVILTRWASYDLANWIMENEKFAVFDKPAIIDGKPTYKRFSLNRLDDIRSSMGSSMFCTPKESPILMGDFTSKPIKDVQVGDDIVGMCLAGDGVHKYSKLVPAKVTAKGSLIAPVYKVRMQSGRVIRCTKEHQWLTNLGRGRDNHHPLYRSLEKFKHYPLTLHYICGPKLPTVKPEDIPDANWLAGIYDGEGSCTVHLTLAQNKIKNKVVYDNMLRVLDKFNFSHKEFTKTGFKDGRGINHSEGNTVIVFGTTWLDRWRFLHQIKPVKDRNILKTLYQSRFCKEEDDVVSYEWDSKEEVFWLETTSGNYVCWGYGSKNSSLFLNAPLAKEFMTFKPDWIKYYEESDLPEDGYGVVTVDPADPPTGNKTQDYSAIVSCWHSKKGIFVRRYVRSRLTDKQLIDKSMEVAEKDGANKIRVEIDRYAHLQYGFREAMASTKQYYNIDAVKTRGKNKEGRIRQRLSPLFENGVIFLKKNMNELEQELFTFPTGSHDDLIDALAWQIEGIYPTDHEVISDKPKRRLPNIGEMLDTIYDRRRNKYPFDLQLGKNFGRFRG